MMTFVDATQSCARAGVPWDGKVSYASVPGIRNQGGTVRAVMKNGLLQKHEGKPWRKDPQGLPWGKRGRLGRDFWGTFQTVIAYLVGSRKVRDPVFGRKGA